MLGWKGGPNTKPGLFLAQSPSWKISRFQHQHCPFHLTKVTSNGKCPSVPGKQEFGGICHVLPSPRKASRRLPDSTSTAVPILPRGYLSLHICISQQGQSSRRMGRAAGPVSGPGSLLIENQDSRQKVAKAPWAEQQGHGQRKNCSQSPTGAACLGPSACSTEAQGAATWLKKQLR